MKVIVGSRVISTGYKRNYVTLKKYTDSIYKLTHIKLSTREPGWEFDDDFYSEKGSVNNDKLDNNISRARQKVYGYSLCNPWQYFSTFTINKTKHDRYDLEAYHKDFTQWLRNYNKKYGTSIRYITIPEQHKDGAWHEHGFIMGLPIEHLTLFDEKDTLPKHIIDKLRNGEAVYNWLPYANKFGWVDFELIKNAEACSKYVTKYITKDLSHTVTDLNAHLYYCSKGLKLPEIIKQGTPGSIGIPHSFENDYVAIYWIKDGNIDKLNTIIEWD